MPLPPRSRTTQRDKKKMAVNFAASGASGALTLDRRTEALRRRQWLVGQWKRTHPSNLKISHTRASLATGQSAAVPDSAAMGLPRDGSHEKTTLTDASATSDWTEQRGESERTSARRRFQPPSFRLVSWRASFLASLYALTPAGPANLSHRHRLYAS